MQETANEKAKMRKWLSVFNGANSKANSKPISYTYIIPVVLIIVSILSYFFISANEAYYKKTIAKVMSVTETKDSLAYDMNGIAEQLYKQEIEAVIMNGVHKGEVIRLQNKTSMSQAYDLRLKVNDEVFISMEEDAGNNIISAKILDYKRDKYIAYIAILFILFMLLIGRMKGLRSLASVVVNIIIFSAVIELYLRGWNLILVGSIASIFFIIISILLVSGINEKTVSAIIGTMAGTLFSMAITLIVLWAAKGKGLYYEEMEFLTSPPEKIFMMEILIGTLGGIMDIAISISSAVMEIYRGNPGIERKELIQSGMEIGKDIMGTMANTLVFVYISGSIPMILLWLKNGYSAFSIIQFNISLEIVRALTGSIGIVISIPITLYISVVLLRKSKRGEA